MTTRQLDRAAAAALGMLIGAVVYHVIRWVAGWL